MFTWGQMRCTVAGKMDYYFPNIEEEYFSCGYCSRFSGPRNGPTNLHSLHPTSLDDAFIWHLCKAHLYIAARCKNGHASQRLSRSRYSWSQQPLQDDLGQLRNSPSGVKVLTQAQQAKLVLAARWSIWQGLRNLNKDSTSTTPRRRVLPWHDH